ncbi:hypothetical protein HNP82_002700 [Catenibacillus scindens]|uniref:IstB-like ATP-binding domain-containing protein n=1 Tax=Catenibacillus scindens TaxID=673271 RepID=A0A7W8M637_9FIRM|nr:ATP-binding protein [Catenibacillus scindens]MBB5265554.1 hypothetical protein [Catenibacillus scindens]
MMKTPEQLKGAIRNLAKKKGIHAQEVLQIFMFERIIERLSVSPYKDRFILKGGLLISAILRYVRLPDLLMEYGDSTVVAGNQRKLLERYSRIPLLILDEWLVSDISDAELHFLFELMERRSDTTSTIFCTQYRKDDWVKRLGEGVRAEAIVDRYAYTAFWIETGSTNMREYCAKHKR